MDNYIEDRHFLPIAQLLHQGGSAKVVHEGCVTQREALFIKNDDDAYWCYCHGCHGYGRVDKTNPRVKVEVPKETGYIPDDLIPLERAVTDTKINLINGNLQKQPPFMVEFMTLLWYSPTTKRVYIPDDSYSFLGYDATGKARARWYSPKGVRYAEKLLTGTYDLYICEYVEDYLYHVRRGACAVLAMDSAGEDKVIHMLSLNDYKDIHIVGGFPDTFRKRVNALKGC